MTSIGIITFHNNRNRGAILQAYSLCEAVDKISSVNVEIIEYRTKSKERERRNHLLINKRPWTFTTRLNDRRIVEGFIDSHLPTSSKSITTNSHERAVEWIKTQDYDMLITGSDEVWKVHRKNDGGLLSKVFPARPFPNLYVLDPKISATKVAYAASANKTNLDRLDIESREILQTHLSAYDYIGVRDRHTKNLVKNLGIDRTVHRVPDPTLLIDIPKGDAESILVENGIDPEKPILGIHSPDKPPFDSICDRYRKQGYQIVSPSTSPFADLELTGKVDPFEYYAMYQNYDIVITNSLHSTIFSLKNGTPFVTVDVDETYTNLESKTYSLLNDFSLLDRHIDAVDGDVSKFFDRTDQFEQKLDQKHIKNRIQELKKDGFEFLEMLK